MSFQARKTSSLNSFDTIVGLIMFQLLFRAYKELRCPLDDFELLAFSSGTKGIFLSLDISLEP